MKNDIPMTKDTPKEKSKEKKPVKKITETYLSNSGAYYLQRYSASTTQFRKVMMRKIDRSCLAHPEQDPAACAAMLETVITRFSSLGYLDDQRYVSAKVRSLGNRGISKRAMMVKLQNYGVSSHDATTAINHYYAEQMIDPRQAEWNAALKLAKKKKLGPYATSEYDPQKAMGVFARAGFSFEIARKILKSNDLENDLMD